MSYLSTQIRNYGTAITVGVFIGAALTTGVAAGAAAWWVSAEKLPQLLDLWHSAQNQVLAAVETGAATQASRQLSVEVESQNAELREVIQKLEDRLSVLEHGKRAGAQLL